jgi:regulator of protease activity HflC (stomatin/prohibitin superfamily)
METLKFFMDNWLIFAVSSVAVLYLVIGINIVSEWERVPVMRFGRYARTLGPGITWLEPFTHHTLPEVDTRQRVITLTMNEGSSLQTHDNVPISFVTVLTKQVDVDNVKKFTVAVTDGDKALEMRTLATVSEVVSRTELNTLLHDRDHVSNAICKLIQERVLDWGVNIIAVEIRDVKITDDSLQEAIALKARAGKEAEAEMVRAAAQVEIARELSLAATELSEGGWKLKGMETLTEMTRSATNNTVVIPSNLVQSLAEFCKH